jgi:hypothetical protein
MKNGVLKKLAGNSPAASLLLIFGVLFLMGFACGGSNTPPPAAYVGDWTGADGTTMSLRADGSANYKSANASVDSGGVTIDEGAKTLKITFAGLGPTFTIDKPPSGDQMTLSGVVYRKGGNSTDTKTDKTSSDDRDTSGSTKSGGGVPSNPELQSLVKQTVLDFNDAVQSGDFSDFHDTLSKPFQDQASPDKLAGVFHEFVENKEVMDFSSVKKMDATFSPEPSITKQGDYDMLNTRGYFPTIPRKTNFSLKYIKEGTAWKLSSIEINTKEQ